MFEFTTFFYLKFKSCIGELWKSADACDFFFLFSMRFPPLYETLHFSTSFLLFEGIIFKSNDSPYSLLDYIMFA